ncbi:MAG: Crp/Fnr family transcriptional regulator [Anaerolineales bacterium]|nr:Crp/Fnr family transcriptional regulator [Anaerolineales bacterium]
MTLYSSTLNITPGKEALIDKFPFFTALPPKQISRLVSHIQPRSFAPGVILFHQDMPGSRLLYMIVSGWVRVYSIGRTGQELTHTILGCGEILGELSLLDHKNHSATALSITQTEVWLLPGTDFEEMLERYPKVSKALVNVLVQRLRSAINHAESLVFQDVLGCLAYEILYLAEHHGKMVGDTYELGFPLTQNELATLVGATRESVNKALSALRAKNLVNLDCASIIVLNPAGLKRVAYERGR